MTLDNIVNWFNEIEKELCLFDKKIAGVKYWERIRIIIFNKIVQGTSFYGVAHPKLNKFEKGSSLRLKRKIVNIVSLLYQYWFHDYWLLKKKYNQIIYSSPRLIKGEDIYVDYVLVDTKKRIYLDINYLEKKITRNNSKKQLLHDAVIRPNIIIKLFKKLIFVKVNKSIRDDFTLITIKNRLKHVFDINVNVQSIAYNKITQSILNVPIYKRIIKKTSVEEAFVVCSYGREDFIQACKGLNVPVTEIQHGAINKYHLGYSFNGSNKESFPDYFWSFGQFWIDITEFPLSLKKAIPIGYKYLNKQIKKYDSRNKKNQIVIISQGTIGDKLTHFAKELLLIIPSDWKIVYKLHPSEYHGWKNHYPELVFLNSYFNFMVIDSSDIQLYKLFAESKVVIGVNSTALFESLIFNVKLYILKLNGFEYMNEIINMGYAILIENACQVLYKYEEKRNIDYSYIFKH